MKKRITLVSISIALVALLSFASCNKKEDLPTTTSAAVTGDASNTETLDIQKPSEITYKVPMSDNKETNSTTERSTAKSTVTRKETTSAKTDADTVTYIREADGLTLTVTVPNEVPYGEIFICVAKITNNTDNAVQYTIPVYDENAHKQIKVSIGKTGNEFIDCDTFGKGYGGAIMNLELKAHESYSEQITFLPGYRTGGSWQKLNEAEIAYLPAGDYEGIADFSWSTESGAKKLSSKFIVTVV